MEKISTEEIQVELTINDFNDLIWYHVQYENYANVEIVSRTAIQLYPEHYMFYKFWFLALIKLDYELDKDAMETAFELISINSLPLVVDDMAKTYLKKFGLR